MSHGNYASGIKSGRLRDVPRLGVSPSVTTHTWMGDIAQSSEDPFFKCMQAVYGEQGTKMEVGVADVLARRRQVRTKAMQLRIKRWTNEKDLHQKLFAMRSLLPDDRNLAKFAEQLAREDIPHVAHSQAHLVWNHLDFDQLWVIQGQLLYHKRA